eukprot:2297998-Prymnesium_polylepis.1
MRGGRTAPVGGASAAKSCSGSVKRVAALDSAKICRLEGCLNDGIILLFLCGPLGAWFGTSSGRCHSLWRTHPASYGSSDWSIVVTRPMLSMPSSGRAASWVATSSPSAELWRRRLSRRRWLQGAQHRQIQLPLPS